MSLSIFGPEKEISALRPIHPCLPLKTGQTTQYSEELDDGFYQAGIAKSYSVLTTGQYSGTTNVDLIHYTAATISFDETGGTFTVLDAANGLAMFKTGDVVIITGSTSNNGTFTVAAGNNAASFTTTEAITDELAGDVVSIAKRESKSNACVVDNNTGLMWLRDPSNYPAKMGVASDGLMPWTGQLYDIFAYCAAVNTASVGGYADWRVANWNELGGVTTNAVMPNATAFPNWPDGTGTAGQTWSATTYGPDITSAWRANIPAGAAKAAKTTAYYVMLVRGGG